MRARAVGVAGAWVAGVVAATAVSWAGVSLAGAEVSPSGPTALSQAEVQHRIRTATGSVPDSSPAPPSPAPTASAVAEPAETSQRSVVTQGGTAVLTCTGDVLAARSSPDRGYGLQEESEHTTSRAELEFSNGRRSSTIIASCAGGVLWVHVEESSGSSDDG